MLLQVGDSLSLTLHELLFLVSKLLLKLDDLLFKLIDPFLELHLEELFVAARIVFELVEHAFIFLLEFLKLMTMLFCQVGLQLLILLLCLRLM